MGKIFISYAHEDKEFADKFVKWLMEKGFERWIDTENLHAGDDWKTAIDIGIQNAEVVIVIMSPNARKSEYVTYEWAFALGNKIPVIPILTKPRVDLHPRLKDYQYAQLAESEPGSDSWENLSNDLKTRLFLLNWKTITFPKRIKEDIKYWLERLNDVDPRKRDEAVDELGKKRDLATIKPLIQLYKQETDFDVVQSIVTTLGKMRSPQVKEILVDALNHSNSGVRVRAANALKNIPKTTMILKKRKDIEHIGEVIKALDAAIQHQKNPKKSELPEEELLQS